MRRLLRVSPASATVACPLAKLGMGRTGIQCFVALRCGDIADPLTRLSLCRVPPQLALISISDHYTRAKLQPSDRNTALLRGGATAVTWDDAAIFPADEDDETPPDPGLVYPDGTPRAIGIIFGRVVEGRVHILYSVELHCRVDSAGMPHFSGSYLDTQLDLIGKVYPDYELLGWYSSGVEPTPADYDFHRRVSIDGALFRGTCAYSRPCLIVSAAVDQPSEEGREARDGGAAVRHGKSGCRGRRKGASRVGLRAANRCFKGWSADSFRRRRQ